MLFTVASRRLRLDQKAVLDHHTAQTTAQTTSTCVCVSNEPCPTISKSNLSSWSMVWIYHSKRNRNKDIYIYQGYTYKVCRYTKHKQSSACLLTILNISYVDGFLQFMGLMLLW